MEAAAAVSVVIPVYNNVRHTLRCLEILTEKNREETPYDIVLVDNGSTDGTAEALEPYEGRVKIVATGANLGFAKGCNRGARAARGRYLAFLNNDTEPRPGWLDRLVEGAERDGADLCGSKLLYPDGRVQHAGIAFDGRGLGYHIFKWVPPDIPAVNRRRYMQAVSAACLLVKRSLFLELGGFDEGYRNGLEDVDFCLRAGAAGKRILYVPESCVVHFEEASPGRKDHEDENLRRYLARWQGKVRSDDMLLWEQEGFRETIGPDGRAVMAYDGRRPGP